MELITITYKKKYHLYFNIESTVSDIMEKLNNLLYLIPDTYVLTNNNNFLEKNMMIKNLESHDLQIHILCQSQ